MKSLRPPSLDLFGVLADTPMLELRRLRPPSSARVFVKLESLGLTGSSEDRVAWVRVDELRSSGQLAPGATLVVAGLGDFAISATMVARHGAHPIHAVIPESASLERQQILRAWGVPLELSPADEQLEGAEILARARVGRLPGSVLLVEDEAVSARIHEHTTGVEWTRSARTDGMRVDAFVCGHGPGGLLLGVGRALRSAFPGIQLHPMHPAEVPHPFQGVRPGQENEGLASPIPVTRAEAEAMRSRLSREEGLLVSLFGAANVAAALKVAAQRGPDARVDTVVPAGGEREFSLWSGQA